MSRKLKVVMLPLIVVLLSGCSQKVIYEVNNGCHIFDVGSVSIKDTEITMLWMENHNDIYNYFCGVNSDSKTL